MIAFNNWQISCTEIIARQYDNKTQKVEVVGKLPDGYAWALLVECGKNKDTLLLERTDRGTEVVLTKDNLSISGNYRLQLRASLLEDPSVTRHTNTVQAYVPASLTGAGEWPKVPTEFTQIEQRLMSINSNPPVPGENGYWMLWNPTTNRYEESTIVVSGGIYGCDRVAHCRNRNDFMREASKCKQCYLRLNWQARSQVLLPVSACW